MNRSNIGNVITNGTQILSVGATTASRFLGSADSALNNMSKEDKSNYYKMKANKMIDETRRYNTGGESATQHLSDNELSSYREFQADNIRKQMSKNKEDGIDDIMSNYTANSEQINHIQTKLSNDKNFMSFWNNTNEDKINEFIDKGEI